jgi:hypothetical protein
MGAAFSFKVMASQERRRRRAFMDDREIQWKQCELHVETYKHYLKLTTVISKLNEHYATLANQRSTSERNHPRPPPARFGGNVPARTHR